MNNEHSHNLKPIQAQFRNARMLCTCMKPIDGIASVKPLASSLVTLPMAMMMAVSSLAAPTSSSALLINAGDQFFSKSCTQVETRVGPRDVAPPLSCGLKAKRKRASPVKVRLSEAEKEVVQRKAKGVGMSINAFIKQVILGANYDPILRKALLSVNRELTSQGNNLNQIARKRNSNIVTQTQAESMLDILGRSMLRTHQAIRQALARRPSLPEDPSP